MLVCMYVRIDMCESVCEKREREAVSEAVRLCVESYSASCCGEEWSYSGICDCALLDVVCSAFCVTDLDTDISFACMERRLSLELLEHTNVTVYRYLFDHISEHFDADVVLTGLTQRVGHTFELPYVFGTPVGKAFPSRFTADEEVLCDRIASAWVRFCEGDAPTSEWPPADAQREQTVVLQAGAWTVENRRRYAECSFWEMVFPRMELVGVGWDQFGGLDELEYEHPLRRHVQQLLFEVAHTDRIPVRLFVVVGALVALLIVAVVLCCRARQDTARKVKRS
jgi:Carboxylesterase family